MMVVVPDLPRRRRRRLLFQFSHYTPPCSASTKNAALSRNMSPVTGTTSFRLRRKRSCDLRNSALVADGTISQLKKCKLDNGSRPRHLPSCMLQRLREAVEQTEKRALLSKRRLPAKCRQVVNTRLARPKFFDEADQSCDSSAHVSDTGELCRVVADAAAAAHE